MGDDVELPDAATEDGTERDGVLSYAGEWHALAVGLAAGTVGILTGQMALLGVVAAAALGVEAGKRAGATSKLPALGEVASEPWYALGGLLMGIPVGHVVGVVV